MKIAIVIRCCRCHGSSRYALEVTKRLVRDNEVHMFTNNWDELDERVIIHKVPTFTNSFYVYEASFITLASAMMKMNKFDVTMAQPTRFFSPDVGYMQFVYREWANYKKANGVPMAFGDSVLPAIEKMNVEKAKKIIVMSHVLKNEVLKNYKVPDEKVEVIYSGVNCDEFSPDNRKLYNSGIRKKLGIEENDIVLLFVGNPYNRKGLEYAVRALPLINEKRVKLLVMGKDLGDEKIANYQALAKKIGVGDKLVYGGFTNEIKKYFSVGDIFVFPTLYEPFGLVITEAMASGMPDVVSRCAGAAELIEDGKEGMLLDNPKNHKEIAEKINYLIDNNLFRKMGKAARAKAETFTWDRTTQQMLSVMEEAAEMKRRKIKY